MTSSVWLSSECQLMQCRPLTSSCDTSRQQSMSLPTHISPELTYVYSHRYTAVGRSFFTPSPIFNSHNRCFLFSSLHVSSLHHHKQLLHALCLRESPLALPRRQRPRRGQGGVVRLPSEHPTFSLEDDAQH